MNDQMMYTDLGMALGLLISFGVGVFVGHRWATESRRLDDFVTSLEPDCDCEDSFDPEALPWKRRADRW